FAHARVVSGTICARHVEGDAASDAQLRSLLAAVHPADFPQEHYCLEFQLRQISTGHQEHRLQECAIRRELSGRSRISRQLDDEQSVAEFWATGGSGWGSGGRRRDVDWRKLRVIV